MRPKRTSLPALPQRQIRIVAPLPARSFTLLPAELVDRDDETPTAVRTIALYLVSEHDIPIGTYVLTQWGPLASVDTGFIVYAAQLQGDAQDVAPSTFAIAHTGGHVITTQHSVISVQHKSSTLSLHRPSPLLERALTSGNSGVRTVFTSDALTIIRAPGIYSAAVTNFLPGSMESLLHFL